MGYAIFGLAIVGGLLIGVWVLQTRKRSSTPAPSTVESYESGRPIYDLIRAQVEVNPDKPLDEARFPRVRIGDANIAFAPGAVDALIGGATEGNDGWKRVLELVRAINAGQVNDWRVVEESLRTVRTATNVDHVLQELLVTDVTDRMRGLFWDLARRSNDYEAVKWGVALGSLNLRSQEVDDLLLLSRHAEFTLYCAHALMRESGRIPTYKKYLVELLPVSRQWGVIRLIDYIVNDKDLVADRDTQREILLCGMENHNGIPMEVAFTIAKAVDLPLFFDEAVKDDRVYSAVVDLMDTLIEDTAPLGGLTDLEEWQTVFDAYLRMIERRSVDVLMLSSLRTLQGFLEDKGLEWSGREAKLGYVRYLLNERFSIDVVRRGLQLPKRRWLALRIIKERQLRELLPQVEEVFKESSGDVGVIDVLGALGEMRHLQLLMDHIPRIVDLESRKGRPISRENVMGTEYANEFQYGIIVAFLGRLGTVEAIAHIKRAGRDYDPYLRSAACRAIAQLPTETIDDELRTVVKERLADAPPYVVEAAVEAARKLGIACQDAPPPTRFDGP